MSTDTDIIRTMAAALERGDSRAIDDPMSHGVGRKVIDGGTAAISVACA